jgi:hypothetical protein
MRMLSFRISILLIFSGILSVGPVFARPTSDSTETICATLLDAGSSGVAEVLDKLQVVPNLRDEMLRSLADPAFPVVIKNMVRTALLERDTEIKHLTPLTGGIWGVPEYFAAMVKTLLSRKGYDQFNDSNPVSTLNDLVHELHGPTPPAVQHHFTVFVKDRTLAEVANDSDFLNLNHELAHIFFDEMLRSQLPVLAKKYPSLVRLKESGRFEIHSQFQDFLHERFAFGVGYQLYRTGLFGSEDFIYKNMTDRNADQSIAQYVVTDYIITNSDVLKLKATPLKELMQLPVGIIP